MFRDTGARAGISAGTARKFAFLTPTARKNFSLPMRPRYPGTRSLLLQSPALVHYRGLSPDTWNRPHGAPKFRGCEVSTIV